MWVLFVVRVQLTMVKDIWNRVKNLAGSGTLERRSAL